MDRDGVVQILRAHELELKAAGVVHLRLFGSVARGEASFHSDIDLMVDLDGSKKLSLLDMSSLENRLSDILAVKVDLALSKSMKEPIRRSAEREAVLAF
jgi:predicted nucleotidyltransferase